MHVPSLNFALGEDIDLLRESVAAFASHHIAPLAATADQDNVFPAQLWRLFGEQGLLGLTVEEEYGGSGMGYLAHVVAMEGSRGPAGPSACRTARIPTCASTSCARTQHRNRSSVTCPDCAPASMSARWR